jgi:4-hydroxy-tetrahydrodipicolinate synthase
MKKPHLSGYIASALVPYDAKLGLNEQEYVSHLKEISKSERLCAVYVNALVGEIYALAPEERQKLITLARQTVPSSIPIMSGVDGHRIKEIVQRSREAEEAGADMIEVIPPFDVRIYKRLAGRPDVPYQFFKELASEVDMPMSIFRYPREYGLAYSTETLVRMAEDIDQVVAMKAGNYTCADYYEMWNAVKGKISVFVTGGDTVDMLGMMMIGADGAQAGIMHIGRRNWAHFISLSLDGKYTEARNLFMEKLAPVAHHIYGLASQTPNAAFASSGRTGSTTALIKEALVAMGMFSSARVRPPDLDATREEREGIRGLLQRLELLPKQTSPLHVR